MNLADFAGPEEIFVDANIFTYFALGTEEYQEACSKEWTYCRYGSRRSVEWLR